MRRLSFIVVFLFCVMQTFAQSPHGDKLGIKCALCHNTDSWKIDYKTIKYDHSTSFALEGEHKNAKCQECHTSLKFKEVPPPSNCISCHDDMHSMSVGDDCVRCHNPKSWLVDHIPELHEENGFPLTGNHDNLSCFECHGSETNLRFDRLGNDCINCHSDDYNSALEPNHVGQHYSMDCLDCHDPLASDWRFDINNHLFFPLTEGHNIGECNECHQPGKYTGLSPECVLCHQEDFDNSIEPKHSDADFSTDCASCHSLAVGWKPTTYDHSIFPLTWGHSPPSCTECHINNNYVNTPTACEACHQDDYDKTTNPNHKNAGISNDCAECHTTGAWTPSNFDHTIFPLNGGHDINDCKRCHLTDKFSDASPECISCHQNDYDQTNKPKHSTTGFSTDCASCHSISSWVPSTFNHDPLFPIYSGEHKDEWDNCVDCHTNSNDYTDFSCLKCHKKGETDDDHKDEKNYSYVSKECFACHPDGKE
jgi:hypothetical protein